MQSQYGLAIGKQWERPEGGAGRASPTGRWIASYSNCGPNVHSPVQQTNSSRVDPKVAAGLTSHFRVHAPDTSTAYPLAKLNALSRAPFPLEPIWRSSPPTCRPLPAFNKLEWYPQASWVRPENHCQTECLRLRRRISCLSELCIESQPQCGRRM